MDTYLTIIPIWAVNIDNNGTVFAPPGNRTIEKTVLFGDCFSTKIRIYEFWNFKVPFFCS